MLAQFRFGNRGTRLADQGWPIAVAVTLAAFMEVLDTTIVNVALPHIAGSLSSSSDEATWALTFFKVLGGGWELTFPDLPTNTEVAVSTVSDRR